MKPKHSQNLRQNPGSNLQGTDVAIAKLCNIGHILYTLYPIENPHKMHPYIIKRLLLNGSKNPHSHL